MQIKDETPKAPNAYEFGAFSVVRAEGYEFVKKKLGASIQTLRVVGVAGFEPTASWTRTKRDTKLRHTPMIQL